MLPRGESEPVALPMSGGFDGSPPPDPLSEYVTLITSARTAIDAQKLRVKAQATTGRKVLEFTLHILSVFWFLKRIRTHAAMKVKETSCKAFVNG
jgi:hypothetical protein